MKLGIQNIYTAIDIGTTKICVIIAQEISPLQFEILGIGIAPSEGLAHGVIVDIERATTAIRRALNEAQSMASFEAESACIGVSGSHIKSYYSQGMTPIKQNIIRSHTLEEALTAAKSIALPDDQHILHVVPVKYIIDGVAEVENPIGMHGMRLEVGAHIITGSVGSIQNLITCCSNVGLKTSDVVLEPIASAQALLSEEEKKFGVLMLDIGGGTADAALYHKGSVQYTEILPIAGNIFTNDLAICLQTTRQCAEEIKREFGIFPDENWQKAKLVRNLQDDGMHEVSNLLISQILHARAEELISLLSRTIHTYRLAYPLPSGIVLTGGGALLQGLAEYTTQMTGLQTRIGIPKIAAHFKGPLEHPSYATAYGLLLYSAQQKAHTSLHHAEGPLLSRIFWKMRSWIEALT